MTRPFRRAIWMCALTLVAPRAAGAQTSANGLFNDSQVQTVQLTMASADWQTLQDNYLKKTWYHVAMTWNGVASVDAGIRSHGGTGSRSPVKPNLDVDFGRFTAGRTYLGVPWILLKANNQDASNLHEWLCMKFFHRAGLPAPREAPAQVYLNGKVLGLYYLVENIDKGYLSRYFGENEGYLYEWNYGDSFALNNLGTDPAVYAKYLDLKSGPGSADMDNFAAMIQAVNRDGLAAADYVSGVSKYIDPGLFLAQLAVENVLGEEDGLAGDAGINNVYLYQFSGKTLYHFLAWDKDRTLQDWGRSITGGILSGTVNQLARRLYAIDSFQAGYLAEVDRLMALFGGPGGWADTEVTSQYELIRPAAYNDPNKQCNFNGVVPEPCGVEDFERGVVALRNYITSRAGVVRAALQAAGYRGPAGGPSIDTVRMYAGAGAQPICPGALASIEGSGLGVAAQASAFPLPRALGNAFVSLDGVRIPLFAVSGGRIDIQVPYDAAAGTNDLVVCVNGTMSNTVTLSMNVAAPVILAVARENGSLAAPGNAPAAGETIAIYALGLGGINSSLQPGSATPNDALALTTLSPRLALGNASMEVLFSGLTPGMVGLYQVNARMPLSLPEGATGLLTLVQAGQVTSAEVALH